jgi:site-specific recombinase XerD
MLSHAWTREAFTKFFNELCARRGDLAAAAAHEHHFVFFLKLDATFPAPDTIDAQSLVRAVDSKAWRRLDLPLNFLFREGVIPETVRADLQHAAQTAANQRTVEQAAGHWYAAPLERYAERLQQRQARTRQRGWIGKQARFLPRTIKNYLITARRFLEWLEHHDVGSVQAIRPQSLDAFLVEHPGLRDGLRPFVQYLNHHEKLFTKLRIPSLAKNSPEDVMLSDQRHRELLAHWLSPPDEELLEALVGLMMLLYCQSLKKTVSLELSQFETMPDGEIHVRLAKHAIPLLPSVATVLNRYLEKRASNSSILRDTYSPYLFPGRNLNMPMRTESVSYRLHKYGVTAGQLFATGVCQAYRSGVKHPKILVTRFGISLITAMKYFELLSPRSRAEYERLSNQ